MTTVSSSSSGLLKPDQDIDKVIERLELSDLHKRFLRTRWLRQLEWAKKASRNSRNWHFVQRTVIVIGGVIIPTLVSLNLTGDVAVLIHWATIALSIVVASTAATEGIFRLGDRWIDYQEFEEMLRIEGWKFFQLSNQYSSYDNYDKAYTVFASQIEDIISQHAMKHISFIKEKVNIMEAAKKPEGTHISQI